jgi:hypothetical protein
MKPRKGEDEQTSTTFVAVVEGDEQRLAWKATAHDRPGHCRALNFQHHIHEAARRAPLPHRRRR